MSVSRGTPEPGERLSVRVSAETKDAIRARVGELDARGLLTSTTELVRFAVDEAMAVSPDELDPRLRRWRAQRSTR
jgi:hypothetical protein